MRHISSIYDASIIPFAFKISPFQQHCKLFLSPSRKSCYSHSEDSVCERGSGSAHGLICFVPFENCDACFYSY